MSESVIADDLHIKGELTTNGDVELKGSVDGDITCRTLMVAEDARIEGSASAEKVVVRGSIDGTINGVRVTLTSSANVTGELNCKSLSIDEEAYFDGRSQRVEDPLKEAKQKQESAAKETAESKSKSSESGSSGNGKGDPGKSSDKSTGGSVDQPVAAGPSY
jgi:cytoskeletal protein CcmA (bactofilin family)